MTNFNIYGGGFAVKLQQTLNDLMSPAKIASTAKAFNAMFNAKNPYKMGTWAQSLADDAGFGGKSLRDGWGAACGDIPDYMRATVELLITNNMTSAVPSPMYFQIRTNPNEPKHQLQLTTVMDFNSQQYIGITIMCP